MNNHEKIQELQKLYIGLLELVEKANHQGNLNILKNDIEGILDYISDNKDSESQILLNIFKQHSRTINRFKGDNDDFRFVNDDTIYKRIHDLKQKIWDILYK